MHASMGPDLHGLLTPANEEGLVAAQPKPNQTSPETNQPEPKHTTTVADRINIALEYLDNGILAIPVVEAGKGQTSVKWSAWTKQLPDEETVTHWVTSAKKYTALCLILAPSRVRGLNLWLLDADDDVAIAFFEAKGVDSNMIATTKRGKHFWFCCRGEYADTDLSALGIKADFKAYGQVGIPPFGGKRWERQVPWDELVELEPTDIEWLAPHVKLRTEAPQGQALEGVIDLSAVRSKRYKPKAGLVDGGGRDVELTAFAGSMARMAVPHNNFDVYAAAVHGHNASQADPLAYDTVESIAVRIWNSEVAKTASEPDQPTRAHTPLRYDLPELPEFAASIGGVLGEMVDYVRRSSWVWRPEYALMASITTVGTILGRKVSFGGRRTNMYTMAVGSQGSGKDAAADCMIKLLDAAQLEQYKGPPDFESSGSVLKKLKDSGGAMCAYLDEFDGVIAKGKRKEGATAGMLPLLTRLWSSAGKRIGATARVNDSEEKDNSIDDPHLCLYATCTPDALFKVLTVSEMQSGFGSRFQAVTSTAKKVRNPDFDEASEPGPWVLEALQTMHDIGPKGSASEDGQIYLPEPVVTIEFGPGAKAVFTAFADRMIDVENTFNDSGDPGLSACVSRAPEKALRLAAVRSVSDTLDTGPVSADVMQWACDLSERLSIDAIEKILSGVGDTAFEQNCKAVLDAIRKAGDSGLTRGELGQRQAFRCLTPRERIDVLDALVDNRQVRSEGLKSKTFYAR